MSNYNLCILVKIKYAYKLKTKNRFCLPKELSSLALFSKIRSVNRPKICLAQSISSHSMKFYCSLEIKYNYKPDRLT